MFIKVSLCVHGFFFVYAMTALWEAFTVGLGVIMDPRPVSGSMVRYPWGLTSLITVVKSLDTKLNTYCK